MVIGNAVENLELLFLSGTLYGSYVCYDYVKIFNRIWFVYILCDELSISVFMSFVHLSEQLRNLKIII